MKNSKKKILCKAEAKKHFYGNYFAKKATALAWASFRNISHDCFTNCSLSFEYAFGVATTSLPGHAKYQNFSTKFINQPTYHGFKATKNRVVLMTLVIWVGYIQENLWGEGLLLGITGPELSWALSVGDAISKFKFQVLETSTKTQWYSLCDDVA